MIKTILILALCFSIGAVGFYFLRPIIMPRVEALLPNVSGLLSDIPTKLTSLFNYVKENWQLVAGAAGSVTVIGGTIANYIHKRKLQVQETESLQQAASLQSQVIQAQGETQTVQQKYDALQQQHEDLQARYEELSQLPKIVEAKNQEVQDLIEQKNQTANVNAEKVADELYKKIKEGQKIS